MRTLSLIVLTLFISSCSDRDSYNRGYVISKSPIEPEIEAPESEDPDL